PLLVEHALAAPLAVVLAREQRVEAEVARGHVHQPLDVHLGRVVVGNQLARQGVAGDAEAPAVGTLGVGAAQEHGVAAVIQRPAVATTPRGAGDTAGGITVVNRLHPFDAHHVHRHGDAVGRAVPRLTRLVGDGDEFVVPRYGDSEVDGVVHGAEGDANTVGVGDVGLVALLRRVGQGPVERDRAVVARGAGDVAHLPGVGARGKEDL